jgi:osmoprotectant transport system ATP-binding protein
MKSRRTWRPSSSPASDWSLASTVAPASVRFDRVVKEYQTGLRVVDDITLDVSAGAFVVLLGPSGCGKTTLLKTVNRLVEPTAGTIFVDGSDVRSLEPTALRRGIGYVIQQVGLFPHMTIEENVAVVPSLLGWPRERVSERVEAMLDLVRLPASQFAKRFPSALSGGQQQRVGLARALAADPPILLMDEPFGALDAIERVRLQGEMAALRARLGKTVLFVTHDVDEALRLADVIVILRNGRVVQHGRPFDILTQPADEFVAELVNASDVVRRFALVRVTDVMRDALVARPAPRSPISSATIARHSDLRAALSVMLTSGASELSIVDETGAAIGVLTLDDMFAAARASPKATSR